MGRKALKVKRKKINRVCQQKARRDIARNNIPEPRARVGKTWDSEIANIQRFSMPNRIVALTGLSQQIEQKHNEGQKIYRRDTLKVAGGG